MSVLTRSLLGNDLAQPRSATLAFAYLKPDRLPRADPCCCLLPPYSFPNDGEASRLKSGTGHLRPSRRPDNDGRSALDGGRTSIAQTARPFNALHTLMRDTASARRSQPAPLFLLWCVSVRPALLVAIYPAIEGSETGWFGAAKAGGREASPRHLSVAETRGAGLFGLQWNWLDLVLLICIVAMSYLPVISRVLSGCNASSNLRIRSLRSSRNDRASCSC